MPLLRRLLLSALLVGCSERGPSALLETYAERVGNALEQPISLDFAAARAEQPAFPPRRERLFELEAVSEGLLEVLDFRQCGLLQQIAERNSSLGKLAGSSQRLIYELHMLPALRACHSRMIGIPGNEAFVTRLERIIAIKTRNLPRLLWNAIYASPEMEQQFALASSPLTADTNAVATPLLDVLSRFTLLATLSRRADWDTPAFADRLEQDYATLYRSAFGAQWLYSLVLLTHTLERTADAIEQRLARRPICFQRRPNNRARIIQSVFQQFYAGQLQPYMALIHRQGKLWLEQQHALVQQLPVPPGASAYVERVLTPDHPQGLWQTYQRARERHTQAWKTLLDQCSMLPGS